MEIEETLKMKVAIALVALVSLYLVAAYEENEITKLSKALENALSQSVPIPPDDRRSGNQEASEQGDDDDGLDIQSLMAAVQDETPDGENAAKVLKSLLVAVQDAGDDDPANEMKLGNEQEDGDGDQEKALKLLLANQQDDDGDEDMKALNSLMTAKQDDGDDENAQARVLAALQDEPDSRVGKQKAVAKSQYYRYYARYYANYYNRYYSRYYSGYYARYYNKYYAKYYKRHYSTKFNGAKSYGNYGFSMINHMYTYLKKHYPYVYRKYMQYRRVKGWKSTNWRN